MSSYVLIYVDCIMVTTSKPSLITEFISALSLSFPVKDLGALHYFLGLEVHCDATDLYMSQAKYISDLLTWTNMHISKPVNIPMSVSNKLIALDGNLFEDPHLHCSVVRSL